MRKDFFKIISLIVAVSSCSMAYSEKTEENEFIIWGSYSKMTNKRKLTVNLPDAKEKKDIFIDLTPIDHKETSNDKKADETYSDKEIPEDEVPEENIPVPSPVENPKISAVKENGIVTHGKTNKGEILSAETASDISSTDQTALWISDTNTKIINNSTLQSEYTFENSKNYSVEVGDNAVLINDGSVLGSHGGVILYNNAEFINNNIIGNSGDYGVYLSSGSTLNNSGIVENNGQYGVYAEDGSVGTNTLNGIIRNFSNYGMYAEGEKSHIINQGLIENSGFYGMTVSNKATALNEGTIQNNGRYGVFLEQEAYFTNNGLIQNGNIYGVYASTGSKAVNSADGLIKNTNEFGMYGTGENTAILNFGIIENTGNRGMQAENGAYALNNSEAVIRNKGNVGMYADGVNSSVTNAGLIENTGYHGIYAANKASAVNEGTIHNLSASGMRIEKGSNGINNGIIENNGSQGMYVQNINSTGINNGTIKNTSDIGMYAGDGAVISNSGIVSNSGSTGLNANNSGSLAVNETSGVISNAGANGIYATNGGRVINNGSIYNGGKYGMYLSSYSTGLNTGIIANKASHGIIANNSEVINEGTISNKGTHGMALSASSTGENKGTINNSDQYGMYITDNSKGINSGNIENDGIYGIYVTGAGSLGINSETGVIANTDNSGMYVYNSATGINNGTIKNGGNFGITVSKATAVNNGTIHLTGDYKTGVQVSESIFTNNGIIRMEGTNNTAIKAVSGSIVKIGPNSQIILNENSPITQSNTDFSDTLSTGNANSNSGGKAYDIDSTSTLINAGSILTSGSFRVQDTGKFVLDTKTGSINSDNVNLEGNLYVNAEGTTNSADDTYVFNNLNTKEISGQGKVISDSYLFETKINKNTQNEYSITMERKNFGEVFSPQIAGVLENNYQNSAQDYKKNSLYNALKINVDSKEKAAQAEKELTGSNITGNLAYQEFRRERIFEENLDYILNKRDGKKNTGIYLNFINTETNTGQSGSAAGYNSKEYGMMFGLMKKINDKTSAGAFFGYLNSDINYENSENSDQKADTYSLKGVVSTELPNNFRWTNILGYNFSQNSANRKITYDKSNTELNADFNSWTASAKTEIEYNYNLGNAVKLRPHIGINAAYLYQNSYTENGSDIYNLSVNSASGLSVRGETGLDIETTVYSKGSSDLKIVPSILYSYEFADPYEDNTLKLGAFDDTFVYSSREAEKAYLNLGIGIDYKYNDNITFYAKYNKSVLNDENENMIKAGFKWEF